MQAVVLLDEVGLAETSPFNPLKVLHGLLEPSYPENEPKVAVIGISNWRLDNSKSSRALLVQRPQLDENDLVNTAEALLLENRRTWLFDVSSKKQKIQSIARSYTHYQKNQKYPNFHGIN